MTPLSPPTSHACFCEVSRSGLLSARGVSSVLSLQRCGEDLRCVNCGLCERRLFGQRDHQSKCLPSSRDTSSDDEERGAPVGGAADHQHPAAPAPPAPAPAPQRHPEQPGRAGRAAAAGVGRAGRRGRRQAGGAPRRRSGAQEGQPRRAPPREAALLVHRAHRDGHPELARQAPHAQRDLQLPAAALPVLPRAVPGLEELGAPQPQPQRVLHQAAQGPGPPRQGPLLDHRPRVRVHVRGRLFPTTPARIPTQVPGAEAAVPPRGGGLLRRAGGGGRLHAALRRPAPAEPGRRPAGAGLPVPVLLRGGGSGGGGGGPAGRHGAPLRVRVQRDAVPQRVPAGAGGPRRLGQLPGQRVHEAPAESRAGAARLSDATQRSDGCRRLHLPVQPAAQPRRPRYQSCRNAARAM